MTIEKSTGYNNLLPPRVFHVYQSKGKASFASLQNVSNPSPHSSLCLLRVKSTVIADLHEERLCCF